MQIRRFRMPLDARLEAEKLRKLYQESDQGTFKALVTGETGTGKTYLLRTARKPVHIDSFDPGGTKGLRDLILKGDIVADIQYELEDPLKPQYFQLWRRNFEQRYIGKYFESFGTYVLDSSTMWAEAIMNDILLKAGRAGETPLWGKDYMPQKILIHNFMKRILNLPCDVIVTGHLKGLTDDEGNTTKWRYMTTGQGAVVIPLLFDEIYVTTSRERAKGIEYRLLTASTGLYSAKTRIGQNKFDTYEEPNIKLLLKKIGWDTRDKPRLELGKEVDEPAVPVAV
jgi:hypothetical protein